MNSDDIFKLIERLKDSGLIVIGDIVMEKRIDNGGIGCQIINGETQKGISPSHHSRKEKAPPDRPNPTRQ